MTFPKRKEIFKGKMGLEKTKRGYAAAYEKAKELNMSYCVISNWEIHEINHWEYPPEKLKAQGVLPFMVFGNVFKDSACRYNKMDFCKSSWLVEYLEPGFFVTKNTLYVLLGEGSVQEEVVQVSLR